MAVAIASVVARTRWHELGGAIAAPVSLAVIAATQATWADVTGRILLVGALAVGTAAWAQPDPWLRLHPGVRHRHIAVPRNTLPSPTNTLPPPAEAWASERMAKALLRQTPGGSAQACSGDG
jgi:hypothetical protein